MTENQPDSSRLSGKEKQRIASAEIARQKEANRQPPRVHPDDAKILATLRGPVVESEDQVEQKDTTTN